MKGIAAIAVLSLALAGCGSSGSSKKTSPNASTAPAATPTLASPAPAAPAPAARAPKKSAYRVAANRICRAARGRLVPIRAKSVAAGNPTVALKRVGTLSGQTAAVYDQTVSGLRGLGAPAGDQGKTDQLNTLLAQLAAIDHQISNAAAAQDRARVTRLSSAAGTTADRYASAARAYGLSACGAAAQLAVARRGNR